MGYLISQIIFCLIAAAVLGVALGWLLHGMLHHEHDESENLRDQLSASMKENHRLRSEIDELKDSLDEWEMNYENGDQPGNSTNPATDEENTGSKPDKPISG